MDIDGHPPIPYGPKQSFGNLLFLTGFRFLNFRGHFEGLNEVFLGQPYMWKRHAIYESQIHSVIVTLGGHIYRITVVVPTNVPPK